jgi:hypothetical protein
MANTSAMLDPLLDGSGVELVQFEFNLNAEHLNLSSCGDVVYAGEGKFGRAVLVRDSEISGISDSGTVIPGVDYSDGNFTLSFWFMFPNNYSFDVHKQYDIISFIQEGTGQSDDGYQIGLESRLYLDTYASPMRLKFEVLDEHNNQTYPFDVEINPADGDYHHFAAVFYSGGAVECYYDNSSYGPNSVSYPTTMFEFSSKFCVNTCDCGSGNLVYLGIDQFRYFSKSLSLDEIGMIFIEDNPAANSFELKQSVIQYQVNDFELRQSAEATIINVFELRQSVAQQTVREFELKQSILRGKRGEFALKQSIEGNFDHFGQFILVQSVDDIGHKHVQVVKQWL